MRVLYVTCALLAITISSIAATDTTGAKEADKKIPEITTVVPNGSIAPHNTSNDKEKPTTPVPLSVMTTGQTTHNNTTPSTPTAPPTTAATTAHATVPSNKTSDATVNPPPKPSDPTVKPEPTTKPTVKPTPSPKTTSAAPATTEVHSTTTAHPGTTMTIPSSAVPYKERHFDGLSFLGGTIFAVCVMGLGAFSWKFFRSCSEQDYSTL